MRRLLYIPILHAEADLGSLAPALRRQTIALVGEERWAKHKEVVAQFWQEVEDYLLSLEPTALRLYQDGLAAEGEAGLRVVEEAAKRGSPNFQLLLGLVRRGAALRKTEDPALLLQERQNLLRALQEGKEEAGIRDLYRRQRDRLMEERDRFIAKTINETLREGEIGVLFLGAQHDVRAYLAPDIGIQEVKAREVVKAYFGSLLEGTQQGRWQALSHALITPVSSQEVCG